MNTNNATESKVRLARDLAGGCPSGVTQLAKFVLSQVKSWSDDEWDAFAERPVERVVWQRAVQFRKLLSTRKVCQLSHGGEILFCCFERNSASDVADRAVISKGQALHLVSLRQKLRSGDPVTYEELGIHNAGRVFGIADGRYHCTCPAFPDWRRCLHTLGHGLAAGTATLPTVFDQTPLSDAARGCGRPPKAGGRYSTGEPVAGLALGADATRSSSADLVSLELLLKALPEPSCIPLDSKNGVAANDARCESVASKRSAGKASSAERRSTTPAPLENAPLRRAPSKQPRGKATGASRALQAPALGDASKRLQTPLENVPRKRVRTKQPHGYGGGKLPSSQVPALALADSKSSSSGLLSGAEPPATGRHAYATEMGEPLYPVLSKASLTCT